MNLYLEAIAYTFVVCIGGVIVSFLTGTDLWHLSIVYIALVVWSERVRTLRSYAAMLDLIHEFTEWGNR